MLGASAHIADGIMEQLALALSLKIARQLVPYQCWTKATHSLPQTLKWACTTTQHLLSKIETGVEGDGYGFSASWCVHRDSRTPVESSTTSHVGVIRKFWRSQLLGVSSGEVTKCISSACLVHESSACSPGRAPTQA